MSLFGAVIGGLATAAVAADAVLNAPIHPPSCRCSYCCGPPPCPGAPARSLGMIPDGWGFIRNDSGLVLDVCGGDSREGARVIAWRTNPGVTENQLWKFSGPHIINKTSGLALTLNRPSGRITVQRPGNDIAQYWSWSGQMIQHSSGHVLDIEGGAREGASVIGYPAHGGTNQRWVFSTDSYGCAAPPPPPMAVSVAPMAMPVQMVPVPYAVPMPAASYMVPVPAPYPMPMPAPYMTGPPPPAPVVFTPKPQARMGICNRMGCAYYCKQVILPHNHDLPCQHPYCPSHTRTGCQYHSFTETQAF